MSILIMDRADGLSPYGRWGGGWWKTTAWSYFFFLLANALDILSSVGQYEDNPLMQHDRMLCAFAKALPYCGFDLGLALRVKGLFLCYYLIMSLAAWLMAAQLNRRLAFLLAAAVPCWTTLEILRVAMGNMLWR